METPLTRPPPPLLTLIRVCTAVSGACASTPLSSSPSAASPSPPPAASAKKDYLPSDWDGNTIEDAYFDEEDTDEELADWRDVRKAKAMLEAMAKAEEDGKSEEDGEGETSEDK